MKTGAARQTVPRPPPPRPQEKDSAGLSKHGGAAGLARALCTDLHKGLDPSGHGPASVAGHKEMYGSNTYKTAPPKNFFSIWIEAFKDPVILLLCAAAAVSISGHRWLPIEHSPIEPSASARPPPSGSVLHPQVSTALGAGIPEERDHRGYIEGIAIWIAIILVTGVGALNDWQKDLQFRKLNEQKDVIKVREGGWSGIVHCVWPGGESLAGMRAGRQRRGGVPAGSCRHARHCLAPLPAGQGGARRRHSAGGQHGRGGGRHPAAGHR